MAKKHKKKRYYTISVTSNLSADKTKYYRSRVNILRFCVIMTILVTLIAAGLTYFEHCQMSSMEDQIGTLREIVTKQETQISDLGVEKAELASQNEILEATVGRQQIAADEQEEINQEKALPTGFPLTDSATIVDVSEDAEEGTEEATDEETDPIIIFSMSDAADVVAAGDGTVTSVREDEVYGNCITIDHGNGYVTIYRNAADPKVSEGDEVVRGAILFVGGLEDNKLGYQVMLDGAYIDPTLIMEING